MLRKLHRLSALILGAFLVLHLGNHLAGLAGQDMHAKVQALLRPLYQARAEPLLLLACLVQAATGLRLAWAKRRLRPARLQALTGAYLAMFLGIHVTAVLAARASGVDTTLAFAAAGFHAPGAWWLFFLPYYGLALMALPLHLSVPLARKSRPAARLLIAAGIAVTAAILALLAGWITPVAIPPALLAPFLG